MRDRHLREDLAVTATNGQHVPVLDVDFVPDCTVRYDEWGGCGVNVLRRADHTRSFVDLTFLTRKGTAETHYLTLAQVEQLRAALDAVTRTDPPGLEWRHQAGEDEYWITESAPRIAADDQPGDDPEQGDQAAA